MSDDLGRNPELTGALTNLEVPSQELGAGEQTIAMENQAADQAAEALAPFATDTSKQPEQGLKDLAEDDPFQTRGDVTQEQNLAKTQPRAEVPGQPDLEENTPTAISEHPIETPRFDANSGTLNDQSSESGYRHDDFTVNTNVADMPTVMTPLVGPVDIADYPTPPPPPPNAPRAIDYDYARGQYVYEGHDAPTIYNNPYQQTPPEYQAAVAAQATGVEGTDPYAPKTGELAPGGISAEVQYYINNADEQRRQSAANMITEADGLDAMAADMEQRGEPGFQEVQARADARREDAARIQRELDQPKNEEKTPSAEAEKPLDSALVRQHGRLLDMNRQAFQLRQEAQAMREANPPDDAGAALNDRLAKVFDQAIEEERGKLANMAENPANGTQEQSAEDKQRQEQVVGEYARMLNQGGNEIIDAKSLNDKGERVPFEKLSDEDKRKVFEAVYKDVMARLAANEKQTDPDKKMSSQTLYILATIALLCLSPAAISLFLKARERAQEEKDAEAKKQKERAPRAPQPVAAPRAPEPGQRPPQAGQSAAENSVPQTGSVEAGQAAALAARQRNAPAAGPSTSGLGARQPVGAGVDPTRRR